MRDDKPEGARDGTEAVAYAGSNRFRLVAAAYTFIGFGPLASCFRAPPSFRPLDQGEAETIWAPTFWRRRRGA